MTALYEKPAIFFSLTKLSTPKYLNIMASFFFLGSRLSVCHAVIYKSPGDGSSDKGA